MKALIDGKGTIFSRVYMVPLLVALISVTVLGCSTPVENEEEIIELKAPSLTLYSLNEGQVFFMMPIDSLSAGDDPIEYWVYYNTNGSDDKIYYGILPSDRTLTGLQSGATIYFFVRKFQSGVFSPYSNKARIVVD